MPGKKSPEVPNFGVNMDHLINRDTCPQINSCKVSIVRQFEVQEKHGDKSRNSSKPGDMKC
jgi:hypothetical protein